MQKASVVLLFLCIMGTMYGQDYDLIVTNTGDSIACRIESATDTVINLRMRINNRWVHTTVRRYEVTDFKYDAVNKYYVEFRPGTSYIDRTYNPQDADFIYGLKLRKNGKTLTIVGGSILAGGLIWGIADPLDHGLGTVLETGVIVNVGLLMMSIGIPMNIAGKKRIEQTVSAGNSAGKNIIIDLEPCAQYNPITQNYQPGLTLRIRF